MQVDLPIEELEKFHYQEPEPADFDEFWQSTIAAETARPLDVAFTPVVTELQTIDVFDVEFTGYGGARIKGWLLLPARRSGRVPAVVEFLGYGGGRGLPVESLAYASAGFAHAILDTRGQGSTWRAGHTPDPVGSTPAIPGHMTRGLLSRDDYYYRRLYVDAYRFVDVVRSSAEVDTDRLVASGRSQGGALSLVVAGLRSDVTMIVPHVPFLCAFRRALRMTAESPYGEVSRWLAIHRDQAPAAFATLAYFDGVSFARRATCPAAFSVGLRDVVSPPSTVFAAHNAYGGPKEMVVWEFNGHESGGPEDVLRTIRAVRGLP
ncbi:acetylxylan esterase [Jiangella alkaliphila]|uniref:Cephalosporin-C deacetylase n=1 Tax=Jiangella alkaliphila TaxID=419479 RepID=A0A1H2LF78_9ACTN|nr:acetylxylan esterase [Jiangella alkaliphila]SDU79288.1 cephalosporin-C deacetylase [Jiangella alkaliphila]